MVFTSSIFIFYFLPITVLLFFLAKRHSVTLALGVLSLASLIFYSWETPYYVFILLFSVIVDWIVTNVMIQSKNRNLRLFLLFVSLFSNLGLLVFFKYSSFIGDNIEYLGSLIGYDLISPNMNGKLHSIILPVGISFYTFQTLSYTIDIYNDRVQKARNFIEFLCYVSAFPQLVAGPIVRYSYIRSQLERPTTNKNDIHEGITLFILGLSKKVLIADSLAPLADFIFDHSTVTSGVIILFGVFAYTLQIYFDFSGYSEMAVGLGKIFGLHFPQNFNSPYKSNSMREFWKRWHMSLSMWFRDYVYIKMGGGRTDTWKRYRNIMLTMGLCGIWHGAGWNFFIWGVGHGFAIIVDNLISRSKRQGIHYFRRIWCLFAVIILWIPFRANDFESSLRIFENLTNILDISMVKQDLLALPRDAQYGVLFIMPVILITFFTNNVYSFNKALTVSKSIGYSCLFVISIYTFLSRDYIPFLYFQF